MSNFANKQFEGATYTFAHLQPLQLRVPLNAMGTVVVDMHVTFGCHCFTEFFDGSLHTPGHLYTYKKEMRAFDPLRYACSLQLPILLQALIKGTIYDVGESYTYAAQITLPTAAGAKNYSIFFSLEKDKRVQTPALRMFVKSAYMKPLVARSNAQNWRFASLAGQITGMFPPKEKKLKPLKKKKKAP